LAAANISWVSFDRLAITSCGYRTGKLIQRVFDDSDLKPLRTPLQCKRSKRCPECEHVLIKPDQKSSSTRFKVKLIASNYLPSITIYRRPPVTISRSNPLSTPHTPSSRRLINSSASNDNGKVDKEPLRPGRTYSYELSFVNPLYEPIQVKLAIARPSIIDQNGIETAPYAVNLPSPNFPISRYAEAWEYEDEPNTIEREDDRLDDNVNMSPSKKKKSKAMAGVIERKGNKTTILMEVAVGNDTTGPIRVRLSFPCYSGQASGLIEIDMQQSHRRVC
jgi:dynactin-4